MTPESPGHYTRRLLVGGGQGRLFALDAIVTVIGTAAGLIAPVLIGSAIDNGIRGNDAAVLDRTVVILLAIALVGFVANRSKMLLTARLAQEVLARARIGVFEALHARSLAQVERETTGRISALLTSDLGVIEQAAANVVPVLVATVASFLVASVILLILSPALFAIAMATTPIVAIAARRFRKRSRVVYRALRERTADAVGALDEEIQGASVAQSYGRADDRARRFDDVNEIVLKQEIVATWTRNMFSPIVGLASGLSTAIVVAVGGTFILNGSFGITVGTITAFVLSLSSIFQPMQQISFVLDSALSARAALERIAAFAVAPAGLPRAAAPVTLPHNGPLTLEGVDFAYGEGSFALRDINLHIEPGEHVALVGRTGAGKSTLAALIVRLADPTRGVVRFGGVSLADVDLVDVRDKIRLVAQEELLLPGTVGDNIRLLAPGATDTVVTSTLEHLGAHGRVTVDADIRALSSGQAQLAALARVAVADPRVVVLDEATSAIDPGAELAADRVLDGRTAIIIAHRPSTAARCDRVVVVDDGRIVADGKPSEMLASGSPWTQLLFEQLRDDSSA